MGEILLMDRLKTTAAKMAALTGLLALSVHACFAAAPCKNVDTSLSKQQRAAYARLIAATAPGIQDAKGQWQKIKPSQVAVLDAMQAGDRLIVRSDILVGERGFFLFDLGKKPVQPIDIWGGVAQKDEIPGLVDWARKRGANGDLAQCFAKMATQQ